MNEGDILLEGLMDIASPRNKMALKKMSADDRSGFQHLHTFDMQLYHRTSVTPKELNRPPPPVQLKPQQRTLPNHLQATKFIELGSGGRIHHVKADHATLVRN